MSYAEAVLLVCDENADAIARIVRFVAIVDPARSLLDEIRLAAEGYAPFVERGLDVGTLVRRVEELL